MTIRSPTPARPKGHRVGTELDGEPGHFRQRAGNQHATGVLAHVHRRGQAGHDRVDVLQRTAEFHSEAVAAGVNAEGAAVQGRLDAGAQLVVLAGDHRGGQLVLCDLARQVRAGNHPMRACGAISSRISLISLKVCASMPLVRLTSSLSVNAAWCGCSTAQGAGGQGDEDQLAIGRGALQVGDRLDPGCTLTPFR